MVGILTEITPTTTSIVTLAEVKAHARITSTAEDATVLPIYIRAAEAFCQREICGGRQFLTAVYDYELPAFPRNRGKIKLPQPPLQAISSSGLTYYDVNNTSQTIASSDYTVSKPTNSQGWIQPVQEYEWPDTYQRPGAVKVRLTAGSSATTNVPYLAKQMVLLVAGDWIANRENQMTGIISAEIKLGVERIARLLGWGFYG